MAIQVSLFAAFAEFIGMRTLEVVYAPGMTCATLWRQLQQKYPRIAPIPALFAVREEYVPPETELQDGDSLMIFPPLSGGSPRYIYDSSLSVQRALEAIRDIEGGGEAVFIGRVRRHSEGRMVRHLFYECEIRMAEKQIEEIIEEMHAKWPLKNVHMEHRIGKLEVEEIAVIVAVSAEHRREALEACRYGIDELKRRVPIWKKEIFENGEEWAGL